MDPKYITDALRDYSHRFASNIKAYRPGRLTTSFLVGFTAAMLLRSCNYSSTEPKNTNPLRQIPSSVRLQDLNGDSLDDAIVSMQSDSEQYIFLQQQDHSFKSLYDIEKEKRLLNEADITTTRSKLEEEMTKSRKDLTSKIKSNK
jgi:hypothetical protein